MGKLFFLHFYSFPTSHIQVIANRLDLYDWTNSQHIFCTWMVKSLLHAHVAQAWEIKNNLSLRKYTRYIWYLNYFEMNIFTFGIKKILHRSKVCLEEIKTFSFTYFKTFSLKKAYKCPKYNYWKYNIWWTN